MITCKCIEKIRDKNNIILGYILVDGNGQTRQVEAKQLKNAIKRREVEVINLSLTADDRLISVDKTDKFDLAVFRQRYADKPIYQRYQGIFDAVGIDVLGAVYMVVPKEGDTVDSIIRKTLRAEMYCLDREAPTSVAELMSHPEALIGVFSNTNYSGEVSRYATKASDVRRTDGKTEVTGVDSITRTPLILLHKDGKLKLVLCSEMEYAMNARVSLMENAFNKKDNEIKRNFAVVTLNDKLEAEVFDAGKKISDREKIEIAGRILRSEIVYWTKDDAAKKMIQKVDRKEMAARLKYCGITTLAVPFIGVLAVGAVGAAIISTLPSSVVHAACAEREAMWAGVKARREYDGINPIEREAAALKAVIDTRINYGKED